MKVFSLHHICDGIEIFAIKTGNTLIHLSFSRRCHEQAIRFLQEQGHQIELASQTATAIPLHYLLANQAAFPDAESSPFIKRGTPFQKKVWHLISRIPPGETRTYGQLARQLGNVNLSRAVGQACNANPLALVIPCHRVVGTGNLGGFAGGQEIKRQLLEMEQRYSGAV